MACHNIFMDNEKSFFQKIKDRDPELILKMVKCVISAHKRKKDKIEIFDITFKDTSSMAFSMSKSEYVNFLSNCLQDMINIEEYEICSEITKIVNKKPITRKRKTQTQK